MKKIFALLCAVCTACVFTACGDDSSSGFDVSGAKGAVDDDYPENAEFIETEYDPEEDVNVFRIHPFRPNLPESIEYGVLDVVALELVPGEVRLSFEMDSEIEPPVIVFYDGNDLQKVKMIAPVKGKRDGNLYVYEFDGPDIPMFVAMVLFDGNKKMIKGSLKNFKMEEYNGKNTSKLSLNYVMVGKYTETSDGVSLDSLCKMATERFRNIYKLDIDTVYMSKASEHPVYGNDYPDDEFYVSELDEDDVDLAFFPNMVASWESSAKDKALDVFIVDGMMNEDFVAISPSFGMSTGKGGLGVLITLRDYSFTEYDDVVSYSSKEIVKAISHEIGHYFGLPHTTATYAEKDEEVGIPDGDNIGDTEVCEAYYKAALTGDDEMLYDCPGVDNIMFPYVEYMRDDVHLTKGQSDIIQKTLPLLVQE